MAKKIGQVKNAGVKKEKVKKQRVAIKGERNDKGLLIAVPADYNPKEHIALSKKDFADTATFFEFRSAMMKRAAARMTDAADKMLARAERLRKYGDEETRKKAERLARYKEQVAELEKYLSEQGIDTEANE